MQIELTTPTLALPRDGLIALRDAQGTRVTTLQGALWITQDSEAGDVILTEGESFTVDRRGLTLVMALTPASLRLLERRAGLVARIRGWFARWWPAGGGPAVTLG
jgi:hypothetical protein